MSRCIELAKNGLGTTYPNPLVGSVVVFNKLIIGEGWHYKAGEPHAEVNAIDNAIAYINKNQLNEEDVLNRSTIYVSLEPCSHWGKTPPCADLIVAKGIKNIVIGSTDPNPKVAGKGIIKLMDAGCKVTVGVMEMACDTLNKRFFTFQNRKRPYIILKWAETPDGFIAPTTKSVKSPVWITNSTSRAFSHKLRAQEQAILVGTNTVLEDNPSLTTRDWKGASPLRIVIDRNLKLSKKSNVFNTEAKTLVINNDKEADEGHIIYVQLDFKTPLLPQLLKTLYKKNIQSLIVEGGTHTLQTFIDAKLWDEAYVFTGNSTFKEGIPAPQFKGVLQNKQSIESDTLSVYTATPL